MQRDVTDEELESLLSLGEGYDTTGDGHDDTTGVSRASMQVVIDRHSDYMREHKYINDAFIKFDTNHTGFLEQARQDVTVSVTVRSSTPTTRASSSRRGRM